MGGYVQTRISSMLDFLTRCRLTITNPAATSRKGGNAGRPGVPKWSGLSYLSPPSAMPWRDGDAQTYVL